MEPVLDPILDVRREEIFLAGHAPGAASIPLEQLKLRTQELPPKGATVPLFDDDADRLASAAHMLRDRGYEVRELTLLASALAETGPARGRLWRPSPFLVEAMETIRGAAPHAPPGRGLDLACGSGREAVWLALQGYEVDAVDILPDALARAEDLAARSGVRLRTVRQDLRREAALPRELYDLVIVFRFLHRPLLPATAQAVAPGGCIVYESFHKSDPRAPRGLADGELPAAFAGFDILLARDGVSREGRRFSQLLARKAMNAKP